MTDRRRGRFDLAELLAAVEDASPVAAADVLGRQLTAVLGATEVAFLIADFSGQALIRLGHAGTATATRTQGRETAQRVALADGPHGRVLAAQDLEVVDGLRVFAPVTNRGEAIGVLELRLASPPDEATLADVSLAAHALAYVIIANRRYTDLFEWGQRSVPLSLAAEIQHRLLPASYTLEAGQFSIAGWLEPAGEAAGDTFDFSLDRDSAHLSMTDAMGHNVSAALLATVLVGAVRNARRAGVGLAEQARRANAALIDHTQLHEFVTGQLVRIDLASGTAHVVNAGHPWPLRLRQGRVEAIALAADPPFGVVADHAYQVQPLPLEPGDRVYFLTDGILERPTDVNLREIIRCSAGEHPREAVQRLMAAVLEALGGELEDDATVMCLDWHGGPPRDRVTSAGANS